jgi:hypothetical protein
MAVWNSINYLALVTMVQAAHGPNEDPLVKLRTPACIWFAIVCWSV